MISLEIFSGKTYRRVFVPGILLILFLVLLVVTWNTMASQRATWDRVLFLVGFVVAIYGVLVGLFFSNVDRTKNTQSSSWAHIVLVAVSLGVISTLVPEELAFIAYILFVLNILSVTLIFSIIQVRVFILIAFLVHLHGFYQEGRLIDLLHWLVVISFPILGGVIAEMVHRFQREIVYNLRRVDTINTISRKLSSSLDEEEIHAWWNDSIREAFEADTYFLAVLNGDKFDLGLFYDDGEYYHAVQLPLDGTLSGWALRNDQTLFLNDLRVEPELEGVKRRLIGKEKTSLSWLGVPFRAKHVTGLAGIASYSPLAFTQDDVELLESLTRQGALALNNARQHELVSMQARIDSLTQVYNHGYFLDRLKQDISVAVADNTPLSLIMLDVDHFKKYNNTYGHLVGDEVLMLMVKTIKRFIKERDSIGRWGGEEFAICLPETSLDSALLVAARIQETLEKLQISVLDQKDIPVPTISQGIAEFPREADEAFRLVDLADKRLYIAKKRGRNQIEPLNEARGS